MSDAAVPVLCEWYVRRPGVEWSRETCGALAAFRDPRGPRWLCPSHAARRDPCLPRWVCLCLEHAEEAAEADYRARERATAAMLRGLG